MCFAVQCKECGKTTWRGCGKHVDQVMANVKEEDRCKGHTEPATAADTSAPKKEL